MPAYSYKERFVPFILDESKDHTVRNERAGRSRHARPGETIYHYYGMRTKWCRKLGEAVCSRVAPIIITADSIYIDGALLSWDEMARFAWKDGFRPEGTTLDEYWGAWTAMRRFWKENHGLDGEHPWSGVVIYWKDFRASISSVVGPSP